MSLWTAGLSLLGLGVGLFLVALIVQANAQRGTDEKLSKDDYRRERSELIARRDLSSNWSDGWRERWLTDHWHEYEDDAALHAHGDELRERIASGYYHRRALEAGRLLRLTPAQVTELEEMYRRNAEEPLKQYALIIARKKKALESVP